MILRYIIDTVHSLLVVPLSSLYAFARFVVLPEITNTVVRMSECQVGIRVGVAAPCLSHVFYASCIRSG